MKGFTNATGWFEIWLDDNAFRVLDFLEKENMPHYKNTIYKKMPGLSRKDVEKSLATLQTRGFILQKTDIKGRVQYYYPSNLSRGFKTHPNVKVKKAINDISNVMDAADLVAFLEYAASRINARDIVSQYTTLETAKKIIENGYIILSRHNKQNDKYEVSCYPSANWNTLYSASFIVGESENMAMWLMYAMDKNGNVNNGARISMNGRAFKEWTSMIIKAYRLKCEPQNFKPQKLSDADRIEKFDREIHKVGYTDIKSSMSKSIEHNIIVPHNYNRKWMFNEYSDILLAGYIKDMAWAYEQELRIRIETDKDYKSDYLAIEIPQKIRNEITVTTNPWYDITKDKSGILDVVELDKINTSQFEGKVKLKANSIKSQ